jgi:hypothetical protein
VTTLLQIDFPYNGPWGESAAEAMRGLAEDIAGTPGLKWKSWTENQTTGRAGGIYLFDGRAIHTGLPRDAHPPSSRLRNPEHSG